MAVHRPGAVARGRPGLDKLDGELADSGFLRVHRRYLVNLDPRPGGRARAKEASSPW